MAGSSLCKLQSDSTSSEDRISELPDAILVDILSLLTMKEAGRSSLLSNRWRNLWKYTSHLNFDQLLEGSMRAPLSQLSSVRRKALQTKYVTWVNQVLGSHERCSLEEFRVHFGLNATFSKDIDEWIKFIISKGAKRIEIDFTQCIGTNFYSVSHECNGVFKSVSNLSNIMCLKSLTLAKVNVEGELIDYLLSKCPHLEMVSISWSYNILRLKVAGPCLPLKYLKIVKCDSLQSIELCAPSLVTFFDFGKPINVVVGRNPLLSELYIEGYYEKVVASCLPLFSSHFSQIETLSLAGCFRDKLELPEISGLGNLKHLVWRITFFQEGSLIGVAKFIMAAPCLKKLTLELNVGFVKPDPRLIEEHTIEYHEGLKEIEIRGYDGGWSHLELARYLIKSAINLEKMVIDPSRRGLSRQNETKLAAKQVAELKGSLSPTVELIIL